MKKKSNIWRIPSVLLAVLILNWLSGFVSYRIDLTEEKRFTLSNVTEQFLKNKLEEDIYITLYLDGSVNSGFTRLEKATTSMIKQFQKTNKKRVSFSQVIIDDIKDKNEKASLLKKLQSLDMLPINVIDEDNNGKRVQKEVYPWALVNYKESAQPVRLLLNVAGKSGDENLNSSIENLEYNFTESFRLLTENQDSRVAFLEGHGELGEGETYDITTALSQYYSVDRGRIGTDATILDHYEAVIIAQPTETITKKDKYVIDQYLMNGGKLLWLVDGVRMSMDSLTKAENNYGIYNDVNIGDMLFRYGVRVNPNLIQDAQCALYPVNIAGPDEKPRYQSLPWFYSPLVMPNPEHSISRNIANVKSEFASGIDIVGKSQEIKKTVLLRSSAQSKLIPVPAEIDLGLSVENLDLTQFNAGPQNVAVLLEGKFSSLFTNRMRPQELGKGKSPIATSKETKMIVISDGSIISNGLRGYGEETQIIPMGYDIPTNQVLFGNKDFILNAVNYLTDDEGWYTLRQRSIKLRLLDKKELERRQFYRIVNVVLPLVALLFLSLILMFIRKRRFSR